MILVNGHKKGVGQRGEEEERIRGEMKRDGLSKEEWIGQIAKEDQDDARKRK